MLGRSHALSGAVGWLGVSAATTWAGLTPQPATIVAGTVVCAASALLPDIDHPGSTVSRTLGPLTGVLSRLVSFAADWVRDRTCRHCATPGRQSHRGLTHTLLGAAVVGTAASLCGWLWPRHTAAITLGLASALLMAVSAYAFRKAGRSRRKRQGWLRRWMRRVFRRWRLAGGVWSLLAAGVVGVAVWDSAESSDWWWLGAPVLLGVVLHDLGDGLTHGKVPLWWPRRINGCRWYRVGVLPRWAQFKTGGLAESAVCVVMLAVGMAAGWALI